MSETNGVETNPVERIVMCEARFLKKTLCYAPDGFLINLARANIVNIGERMNDRFRDLPAVIYCNEPLLISTDLDILNT